jgi:hypothetical protein
MRELWFRILKPKRWTVQLAVSADRDPIDRGRPVVADAAREGPASARRPAWGW